MRVYFRADGDSEMGLGHIVRCGALAEMINGDFDCILLTRCTIDAVIKEAKQIFSEVIQWAEIIKQEEERKELIEKLSDEDILVLDGYQFREEYQDALRRKGASLICIDDIHSYSFKSSVIINSAGGIRTADYLALPQTQFYLGPRYTLLRTPFLKKSGARLLAVQNKNIFICLGGSDPNNITLTVLKHIIGLNRFEKYNVVVGGGYLYFAELQEYISENDSNITLYKSVSASMLAGIMAESSYAICAPSTVSYEYMTVGGIIYLKQTADNQQDMLQYLVKEGLAFSLGDITTISTQDEQKSLEKQAAIFDGKADQRLKAIFDKLAFAKKIRIRNIEKRDMMLCYDWANDPLVRAQSYNNSPILLSDHEAWFEAKINDKNSFFYILEWEGWAFAQVRFQVNDTTAIISFLVDKVYRNKGLGSTILSKGIEAFLTDFKNNIEIIGFVKVSNIASQRSFEKLNFNKKEAHEHEASYKYVMGV